MDSGQFQNRLKSPTNNDINSGDLLFEANKDFKSDKDFKSSSIDYIRIENNQKCYIQYNSSNKEYEYDIINPKFVELLLFTINSKESVGKFINTSIRKDNYLKVNLNMTKINLKD